MLNTIDVHNQYKLFGVLCQGAIMENTEVLLILTRNIRTICKKLTNTGLWD